MLLQQLLAFGLLLCTCHVEALRAAAGPIVVALTGAQLVDGGLRSARVLEVDESKLLGFARLVLLRGVKIQLIGRQACCGQ